MGPQGQWLRGRASGHRASGHVDAAVTGAAQRHGAPAATAPAGGRSGAEAEGAVRPKATAMRVRAGPGPALRGEGQWGAVRPPDKEGRASGLKWDGWAMCVGAGLALLLLNVLFRYGAKGDKERDAEEAAREYFAQHGRWPDES